MEDKFIACSKCGNYPNIEVVNGYFHASCPVCKYGVQFEIRKTNPFGFNNGIKELINQWNNLAIYADKKIYGGNTDGK